MSSYRTGPDLARHEHEPRRRGHLKHGGLRAVPAQETVVAPDGLAHGARHLDLAQRAIRGGHEGLRDALAAVHHRRLQDLSLGDHPQDVGLDAVGHLVGPEALLETGWCHDDTQRDHILS
jgi:hypothetical protein